MIRLIGSNITLGTMH